MKKTTTTIVLLIGFLMTTFILSAQEVFVSGRLEKLWESKPELKKPESVLFDPADNIIYVSNINGDDNWGKDGNGFISTLFPEGDFMETEFVGGLDSPKGLGIYKGKLYVADVTQLVEIDIKARKISNRYPHEKAINLNDVAIGDDGTVYVSDSKANTIYELKNGKLDVFVEADTIAKTNGLWVKGDVLLAGSKGRVAAINIKTKEITTFIENTGRIDGLVPVGDGSYLISDWAGNVFQIEQGKPAEKLLDTTPLKINAADISFIIPEMTLLVPTFNDNKVVAYKLSPR